MQKLERRLKHLALAVVAVSAILPWVGTVFPVPLIDRDADDAQTLFGLDVIAPGLARRTADEFWGIAIYSAVVATTAFLPAAKLTLVPLSISIFFLLLVFTLSVSLRGPPQHPLIRIIIPFIKKNMTAKTLATALISSTLLVGVAIPALAQTGGATGTPTSSTATTPAPVLKKKELHLSCVQTAVDAREAAIGTAFGAFSTAESAALATRKSALHDAWGITTAKERRTAREKAWSDFRTANKAAFKALRDARKSAWSTFEAATKSCGTPSVESAGGEGVGNLAL